MQILSTARKQFGEGGPKRLPFTLPPLIFAALKVAVFHKTYSFVCVAWKHHFVGSRCLATDVGTG